MGKFSFDVPDDFMKQLGKLSDIDRIAPKMIDESMPILTQNLKSELAKHKRTGNMINSVKTTKAGKTKNGGYYAVVRPTGVTKEYMDNNKKTHLRKKGPVRNMEILAYLEYGTSKQPATPILTKAIKDSETEVLRKMQEVFNREVGR